MEQRKPHVTRRLAGDAAGVAAAAEILRAGGLVAFPTETVYGLGGDATQDSAIAAIYAAKGRPAHNPLIVHVSSREQAESLAGFTPEARKLAQEFWPGPLSLVLPMNAASPLSDRLTAGLGHVALRMPAHSVALALIAAAGVPIAAPSANMSGRLSPTRAEHVLAGLDGRIDAVLDGGDCAVGLESTIIGFDQGAVLLRPGGIPLEAIEACLGKPLLVQSDPDKPNAPGQLASHYAPKARLRLNAREAMAGEVLLGFGPVSGAINLSPKGDLTEAAAHLFAMLHRLDQQGHSVIAVAPIPETGLGRAINDRLRRAAAPRG